MRRDKIMVGDWRIFVVGHLVGIGGIRLGVAIMMSGNAVVVGVLRSVGSGAR
jgi:hypothetical protein